MAVSQYVGIGRQQIRYVSCDYENLRSVSHAGQGCEVLTHGPERTSRVALAGGAPRADRDSVEIQEPECREPLERSKLRREERGREGIARRVSDRLGTGHKPRCEDVDAWTNHTLPNVGLPTSRLTHLLGHGAVALRLPSRAGCQIGYRGKHAL